MVDIDTIKEIAALVAGATALGTRAGDLAPGECLRVTVDGRERMPSKEAAGAMAAHMMAQRGALLDGLAPSSSTASFGRACGDGGCWRGCR